MKAVAYKKSLEITDADSLFDVELAVPIAKARDLVVKVKAISVNPVDTKVRKRAEPPAGEVKVLGWDACGIVESIGSQVQMFKPGDEVWYAGAINRPGCNSELHLVDERIVAKKPMSLDYSHAAALPLTSITAWELLFDRLQIPANLNESDDVLLIMGAAGGVGSILTQLATQLTGATVIGSASREETYRWVYSMGAHHVIDHKQPLMDELKRIDIPHITHVASLTRSDLHLPEYVEALSPFGKIGMIDDPGAIDFTILKSKSLSLHWELMFTRSLFNTEDMIEQHRILTKVSDLVDADKIKSTMKTNFGLINAQNIKKAHAFIESGQSVGKLVLENFDSF